MGTESPHATRKSPLNNENVKVSCAISVNQVIRPYHFHESMIDGESFFIFFGQLFSSHASEFAN